MFIGLNPSVANEMDNDRTLNRCINFAKSWNYGGVIMANLFAFVSTDPSKLFVEKDPIGIDNNLHLISNAKKAEKVVAAWGNGGTLMARDQAIIK